MNSTYRPERPFASLRGWAACLLVFIGTNVHAQTIQHFSLGPDRSPYGIAAGPDGNIWFTVSKPGGAAAVSVMSTDGQVITEYRTTSSGVTINPAAAQIVVGPDNNLWFIENLGPFNNIARITLSGTLTEYPTACFPIGITGGPQNSVWFTEIACADSKDRIGQITAIAAPRVPVGTISEYPIGSGKYPSGIVASADGDIWFSEAIANAIGRLKWPTLELSEFSIPTLGAQPKAIALATDGNIWFSESNAPTIGRITLSGSATEFDLPMTSDTDNISGIVAGSDGNLWTGSRLGDVSRIEYAGSSITQTLFPAKNGSIVAITLGPDGNIWFTEPKANKIGVVHMDGIFLDGLETN